MPSHVLVGTNSGNRAPVTVPRMSTSPTDICNVTFEPFKDRSRFPRSSDGRRRSVTAQRLGAAPAREEGVGDAELIEGFANRVIDDIFD